MKDRTAPRTVVVELNSRRRASVLTAAGAQLIQFPRQRQGNWPLEGSQLEGPDDPDGPDGPDGPDAA